MENNEWKIFDTLIEQVQCSKKFACVKSNINDICRTGDCMNINHIKCLNAFSTDCHFRKDFSSEPICQCPLRKYITKTFNTWTNDSMMLLKLNKNVIDISKG